MSNYTPEEQARNRKKWIEALESGDYTQARGYLRNGNSYCCLGVACDISGMGKWLKVNDEEGHNYYVYQMDEVNHESSILPKEVADWLGIDKQGYFKDFSRSLLQVNDSQKKNFKQIASMVRAGRV